MKKSILTLTLAVPFSIGIASAQTYQANLTGSEEVPATASTATGIGTIVLFGGGTNNVIKVDESWSGLAGTATASYIHGPAGVGGTGPILFTLTGVPSATSGAIPEQFFSINHTQIGYLQSGLLYMDIYDSSFASGEIRGQLTVVPEPSTLALLGLSGMGALLFWMRRRTQPSPLQIEEAPGKIPK